MFGSVQANLERLWEPEVLLKILVTPGSSSPEPPPSIVYRIEQLPLRPPVGSCLETPLALGYVITQLSFLALDVTRDVFRSTLELDTHRTIVTF